MPEYQGEKFKSYLKNNKISVIEAAKTLGVSRNTVYQYFRSDNLERETVINIITKFNTTDEEVFGVHTTVAIKQIHQNAKDLGDPTIYDEEGNTKFTEISPGRYRMGVELVPEYARAGYLSGYADQEYISELPLHYITVDRYVRGKYRAFEISGDSMDNGDVREALPHGTIATGREVKRDLWYSKLHSHQWPNWIFIHKTEGIIAKQISSQDVDKGILTLRSLNPDKKSYPDFDINIEDLIEIYNVVKRELK
jgi:transcriptional regulator with XRE-family HTH domain